MRIKKIYQGELPENKILNVQSESATDTYSCDYINNLGVGGGDALDELPIGSVIRYDGEDIPEGWEEIEDIGGTSDLETKPLSSMTLNLTEEYTITSEARYTQVVLPMQLTTSNGHKFTYENNGVRIGAGVSKVIISAQLGTRTQVKDALYGVMIAIYRDETYLTSYRSLWIGTNTQYTTEQVSPNLIDVQEGDLITVAVYIDAVGPSIKIQTKPTYLTVQEVPDTNLILTSEPAKWKLLQANVAAGVNVDISTLDFEELYVEARVGTQTEESANFIQTFHILKASLSNETKYYRHGAYFYTNYNGAAVIEASLTSIKSTDNYFNGKVVNTYTKVDIYYR